MASPSATLQKKLRVFVDRLMTVEEKAFNEEDLRIRRQEVLEEGAVSLQNIKMTHLEKLRLSLENEKLTLENEQLRHGANEKNMKQLKRSMYGLEIVQSAIEKRKANHQKPNVKVSKDIIQHGVITFAGGRRRNIKNPDLLPPNARIIKFDKNGLKKLTYQNDRGQIISEFDTRVFLGLHKLWEKYGRKPTFSFTEYELLQVTNIGTSGKEYDLLQESLNTLFATSVIMHAYYVGQKNETIVTEQFHLIQSKGQTQNIVNGNVYSVEHRIEFSNYLQQSLEEGYVSYISLSMLEDLQSAAAQSLYLMLCSETTNELGYYEYPLQTIINHIHLTGNTTQNRVAIENALEEMRQATIIKDYHIDMSNRRDPVCRILPTDWFRNVTENVTADMKMGKLLLT